MNTKLFISIDAGHQYTLANHDGDETKSQILYFIKKAPVSPDSTEMEVVQEGTTNEAVISMLIDRMNVLNEKFPSPHNDECIKHLSLAYEALYARTKEREERGVEGKHIA